MTELTDRIRKSMYNIKVNHVKVVRSEQETVAELFNIIEELLETIDKMQKRIDGEAGS